MNRQDIDRAWIVRRAKALGFDLCGIVRAEIFSELDQFKEWLDLGYAGEMKYLADPKRTDPSLVMQDLRSVVVCALNYNTAHAYSTAAGSQDNTKAHQPRGWISRYAWGDDYHAVMWDKLNALTESLKERFPGPFIARAYADTGPVAERLFAKHAGLGWLGKNTLLINKAYGSWLFLGVILTTLDLPPSIEPADGPSPDLCGSCRRCLDACPTKALVQPYVLDARRCISYLTIELRGSIPDEFRQSMGWQVYGCDICQDVCPYNRRAPVSPLGEFQPREWGNENSLLKPSLVRLAKMDRTEFQQAFQNSAVKRTKWVGLVRNACLAIGNSADCMEPQDCSETRAMLSELSRSEISTIAESAQWALSRIEQKCP